MELSDEVTESSSANEIKASLSLSLSLPQKEDTRETERGERGGAFPIYQYAKVAKSAGILNYATHGRSRKFSVGTERDGETRDG